MSAASDAAAFWGSAENMAYPAEQRLAMALKALEFYGNVYDKVDDALTRIAEMDGTQRGDYGLASRDAVAAVRRAMS